MTVDIAHVIQEIREEAERRRSQPVHPDRKLLKPTKVRIRPPKAPFHVRALAALRREKLGVVRRLYRVPGVGYILRWFVAILRLPIRLEQLYQSISHILPRLDNLENISHALQVRMDQEVAAIQSTHHKHWMETVYLMKRTDATEGQIRDLIGGVKSSNALALDNKAQIRALLDRSTQTSGVQTVAPVPISVESDPSLDHFYVEFENHFRGSTEQIRQKQSHYLPFFKNSPLDFSKERILDIGCGRGEWLKLLRDENFQAIGVDSNTTMVETCKNEGLQAQVGDALTFLRAQPAESLGCVTGFHIVEHLPFNTLIRLIDEILRVLKPGGMTILETPNPENVIVGSCNFYIDPTHKNPLPPPTLAFFLEQRGFQKYETLRLSPIEKKLKSNDPLVEEIAARFYKEQDYAIIAYKL